MNIVSETLVSIANIDNATLVAQESVMDAMKSLNTKYNVMQEYHLEVASEDEVIQEFITNRDRVITEYENLGPKKIYQKLLGMCNLVIPHFKKLNNGLKEETINHQEIDNWGGTWLDAFFGFGAGSVLGQGSFDLDMVKSVLKKTDKKATRDAFSEEDKTVLRKLDSTAEAWKKAVKYERGDRKFFDKFIAFTRDTRDMSKVKKATQDLVDALEETRDMAKKHFNGSVD